MISTDSMENIGVVETLKNSMQPGVVAEKLGVDKNFLIDIGVYGAVGFISGFLLKKYSEYFISLALLLVGLILLQQFDYINLSMNSTKIHTMLGLQGAMSSEGYSGLLWDWVRAHVISASSFTVGFLVGLKVA